MLVTPTQWIDQVARAVATQDWNVLTELEVSVNQFFAVRRDWNGLEQFYDDVLIGAVSPDIVQKVRIRDIGSFQAGVGKVLRLATERAEEEPNIKAIYFEYFYDGGDWCTGDVFLCSAYQEDDDSWAAYFDRKKGVIEGPNVHKYLSYDPDLEFEPFANSVSSSYVDGFLLAAWGREVDKLNTKLPMGFAQHDHPVITVNPADKIDWDVVSTKSL